MTVLQYQLEWLRKYDPTTYLYARFILKIANEPRVYA